MIFDSKIFDSNALVISMKQFSAGWEQREDALLRFSRQKLFCYIRFLSEDPFLTDQIDTASFTPDDFLQKGIYIGLIGYKNKE